MKAIVHQGLPNSYFVFIIPWLVLPRCTVVQLRSYVMKENAHMREAPRADAAEKSKGFWQTLPGILTGVAALITAVTGLIVGVLQTPLIHHPKNAESEKIGIHARQADDPAGQSAKDVNLLAPENGGHLVLASSPDWRQTTIRKGFGVVGAHDPEEAISQWRGSNPDLF